MSNQNRSRARTNAATGKEPSEHSKGSDEGLQALDPAVALERTVAASPSALAPANVLALQASVGNQAVRHLLARRASSQPASAGQVAGDSSARDADGVAHGAEAVVDRAAASIAHPLPAEVRDTFERSLGVDLSEVRLHTGPDSAQAADAVGALAYTTGQDIHFAAGRYAPADAHGAHLLAHEVAHTVQQRGAISDTRGALEVSHPRDSSELAADRAATAMVTGARTEPSGEVALIARKTQSEIDAMQGAGDAAATAAAKAPLSIDSVSVTADKGRVKEIIAEIDKNETILKEAEKEDDTLGPRFAPLVTNATTKANIQVFNDSLDLTGVDTAAFGVQYRTAHTDYMRLVAEGGKFLTQMGAESGSLDAVSDSFGSKGKDSLKIGESQAGLIRFRTARANLNTAASKMDGEMKAFRGAAQSLQGALYSARGKAAAAKGAEAATKLAAVKKEISDMAASVGMAIKVASAVAGFVGTGGGVSKVVGDAAAEGERAGAKAIAKAVYKDANDISQGEMGKTDVGGITVGTIESGDPAAIAESLVKMLGEHIHKDKIANLQQTIATAAAEEKSFNAAAEASTFAGHQTNMEAAATKLKTLVSAFDQAKIEMKAAGDALMEELSKGGQKGKDQSKGVLLVTDADRFLAQVTNAITVGRNQQANATTAADQRKSLRGTTSTLEGGKDRRIQQYWTCTKTKVPGTLWGTNDVFKPRRVDVTFTDGGQGSYNSIVQGGAGTVEGSGGAADEVRVKLEVLEKAKTEVQSLQTKVQSALGMGGPGLNA